ncbi:MAG: NFACT family protein [Candidatus Micrarchaeota archaeon]|nr:NFACT family protein [Candidatus Micrarchaeota archaeon]
MALSNLDVHFLVRELRDLENEHLQKVYGFAETYRFKFRSTDLVAHLPDAVFATPKPPAFAEHPSAFIMRMRKLLSGRPLGISQVGFDRILRMDFLKASVVLELFADGNLLLLDDTGIILNAWRTEEFASRKLRSGQRYVVPPMGKRHPAEFDAPALSGLSGPLVSALSKAVNLSPLYLEEACRRAALDKKMPVDALSDAQKQKLKVALASLLEGFRPGYHENQGVPALAVPFPLTDRDGFVPTASFSEAIRAVFEASAVEKAALPGVVQKKQAFVLEQQQAAVEAFQEKAAEAKAKGDWFLEHAELVEKLRQHSDASEETLRELAPGLKFRKKKHVLELDVDA